MSDPIHIDLPIPAIRWHTANDRMHWAKKAQRTKQVRFLAFAHAKHLPHLGRANVHVTVCYPTARRADPANASPVAKAAIDGIVDAGVLDDDDHQHVPEVTFSRGPDTGQQGMYRLIVRLDPL